jgi:toxin ParE1/3/4
MTDQQGRWRVRLTAAAERDFNHITAWTTQRFGRLQAGAYIETLLQAFDALQMGPKAFGAKARKALGPNIYTLHASRRGRRSRHILVFRCDSDDSEEIVQVLRILHDAMDVARHFSASEDDAGGG